MRVLIDTNVLISAALRADGTPWLAYQKAASYPNHGLSSGIRYKQSNHYDTSRISPLNLKNFE